MPAGNHLKFQGQYKSCILKLRKAAKLSRRALAEKLAISVNTLADWERAIPKSFVIAFNICDYFEPEIKAYFDDDCILGLKNIATLRKKAWPSPVSRRQLAQHLDVSENTVVAWEAENHSTVQKLEGLCQYLDCDIGEICQFSESVQSADSADLQEVEHLCEQLRRHVETIKQLSGPNQAEGAATEELVHLCEQLRRHVEAIHELSEPSQPANPRNREELSQDISISPAFKLSTLIGYFLLLGTESLDKKTTK